MSIKKRYIDLFDTDEAGVNHIFREYFALEDHDPIPTEISDEEIADIICLISSGHYE